MHPFTPDILDYIAQENPSGVNKLFIRRNYDPPQSHEQRVAALVQIIEIEGKPIHPEIWSLHPGRRSSKPDHGESCYCGACNSINYTGDTVAPPKEEPAEKVPMPKTDREWMEEKIIGLKRNLAIASVGLGCLIILVASLTRNG